MSSLRFLGVWSMASVASFGAILIASGGRVLAPREDFDVDVTTVPASAPALQSGREKAGISPRGPFFRRSLVDPKKRGNRALRHYEMSSPLWHVEIAGDERQPRYRHIHDEPLLELFGLRKDEQDRAISDWVQVRITAAEAVIELRHPNIENLDPEVPVVLRRARVELDQDGDGSFETVLIAPEASCRVETASSAGARGVPLREIAARGSAETQVSCNFEEDLSLRADTWHWQPESDLSGPTTFEFGAHLLVEMTNRRERPRSRRLTRTVLSSPEGGELHLAVPNQDAQSRAWRRARFTMPFPFRMDQVHSQDGEAPVPSWITGRDAWIDVDVASTPASAAQAPNEPRGSALGADDRARLVAARVEHDLHAGGAFGEIEARAATFQFEAAESNRIRDAEFTGPVVFTPREDANWMESLFGAEHGGTTAGRLELRCREGASMRRPADLPSDRDGYEIELREDVKLAVSGGPEIFRAGSWLRTRCEKPPAEVLAERDPSEATRLEPRWIEASKDVRLDHQGSVATGGHLHVRIEGWGERATRRLVLTDAPHVRVQPDPERPPLDLSCQGPLELRLGASGLERAELRERVRVAPVEPDPAQLHLQCEHLIVAGADEKEMAFKAIRGVVYDEGDRHVACEQLERGSNGHISVLGTPAVVSIVHEGEPVVLRALWIGFDEARGTFYALGLAHRVQLEPPASLARIEATGAGSELPRTSASSVAKPLCIEAHFFAAELAPERTKVLGIGRVSVEGELSARADWLWARKDRTSRLALGGFGPRRIDLRKESPTERVRGSSRRMVWSEKDRALRLLGAPRLRWSGSSEKGFDVLPGIGKIERGERSYDLRADAWLLFTVPLVELRGRARVAEVGVRPFEISGRRIVLDRDPQSGAARRLRVLEDAYVNVPADLAGAPPLLEVNASQIQWDASTNELHIRSDEVRPRVTFSFQGQSDSARYVVFVLEPLLLKEVRR